jgi:hypothetical protein
MLNYRIPPTIPFNEPLLGAWFSLNIEWGGVLGEAVEH